MPKFNLLAMMLSALIFGVFAISTTNEAKAATFSDVEFPGGEEEFGGGTGTQFDSLAYGIKQCEHKYDECMASGRNSTEYCSTEYNWCVNRQFFEEVWPAPGLLAPYGIYTDPEFDPNNCELKNQQFRVHCHAVVPDELEVTCNEIASCMLASCYLHDGVFHEGEAEEMEKECKNTNPLSTPRNPELVLP